MFGARIRDAQAYDLPAIVAIYNSTIPGRMATADLDPISVESRYRWFQEHTSTFRPLWVVEKKDGVVAWLSFSSFYGRPAYHQTVELSIYIHEQHRQRGLGSWLLQEAIDFSPRIQVDTLLGFIFAHNLPSLGLFKKFEFVQWGFLPKVAWLDGVARDLVILGKKVVP
jgi:phosphinothricin acetyltransferase